MKSPQKLFYDITTQQYLKNKNYQVDTAYSIAFAKGIAQLCGKGKKILDIGCGHGKIIKELVKQNNIVKGIDLSSAMVNFCRQQGFDTIEHDIENGDLLKEKFDAVIMTDVLEHLYDPIYVLTEKIKPILNKQGLIIATVPNFVFIKYRLELLFGRISHFNNDDALGLKIPRPYNLGHKTLFNKKVLKQTFELSGFTVTKLAPDLLAGNFSRAANLPVIKQILIIIKKSLPTIFASRFLIVAKNN